MFIEINDISTGAVVKEPLNVYSINYVYDKEVNGKYRLIYMLVNGLRKIEEFNSKSDLDNRLEEIKEITGGGGKPPVNVYTYKGSCSFEDLPTSGQIVGDVYDILNDFTLDSKDYPAGTNVAWDGTKWDALSGSLAGSIMADFSEVITIDLFQELLANDFASRDITSSTYPTTYNMLHDLFGSSSFGTKNISAYVSNNVIGNIVIPLEVNSSSSVLSAALAGTSPFGLMKLLNIQVNEKEDSGSVVYYTVSMWIADLNTETIQYTSMPSATSENVGQIVQYVGVSNANYINGYFYKCTTSIDEQTQQTTYSWERISVQPESDMSNYYTKQEIDSMIGDITEVLSHLTVPTAIEQELSEI